MKSIDVYNCKREDLMRRWKDRYSGCAYFTEDGIVNYDQWSGMPEDRRIVFLLKEAYTSEKEPSDWNEAGWLDGEYCRENCAYKGECAKRCRIKGNSFNRIAEWTYYITELSNVCFSGEVSLEELSDRVYWLGVYDKKKTRKENNAGYREKRAALLKKIAVVNLKKADGKKHSNANNMVKYAESDEELLIEQLALIQPHFVVCCGTWNFLREEMQKILKDRYEVIKTPHPNAHIARMKMLEPVMEYFKKDR